LPLPFVPVPYFTPLAGQQSLPVFASCSHLYEIKKRTLQSKSEVPPCGRKANIPFMLGPFARNG
jgi:hypothetical protein